MRIGVIGAGFAGLTTAKTMKAFGHDVEIFDASPDIGGVWSATRRYPGLTTQNNRSTYGFSDFPMPASYPEWPSGEQVQAYLESYAIHFGLVEHLHLSREVVAAELDEATGRWQVRTVSTDGRAERAEDTFDHLVVCNGIFSDPYVPEFPGATEFAAAGGRLCHTSQLTDREDARDAHVVVVGYGKSACDLAGAVSDTAASTTVVARELLWKLPRRIAGLNYKYLLLTRLGESLFEYIRPVGLARFLHRRGRAVSSGMLRTVETMVRRQLRLDRLGLVPAGSFERIARSTVSLVTEGFYDAVAAGAIKVHRGASIVRLCVVDGKPSAELSSGEVVRADLVVCGTGFHQRVPFFSDDLLARVTDERGNFTLYRQILPLELPNLTFNGYNSSLFSPLSAEMAAVWTADLLAGGRTLLSGEERHLQVEEYLRWLEERTEGKHAHGTNIIPFSLHTIDELLSDLDVRLPAGARLRQWLLPVDPRSYRRVAEQVLERHVTPTSEHARERVPA